MRKIENHKLESLKKLTSVRKVMFTSELALAQAKISEKENEIRDLKTPISNGTSLSELNSVAHYQVWRQKELPRLIGVQAALRAEFSVIQRALGQAVAQDATADHLKERLNAETRTKNSRRAELSNSSHLLANNISDQNI